MGKTSAMKSFLSALDSFDEKNYEEFRNNFIERGQNLLPEGNELGKYEFICLECIDASLLEEKEDIFEVVLAKMLSEIIKEVRSCSNHMEWEIKTESRYVRYRKEDIFSKMENIYEGLCNIRNIEKRRTNGTGAMGILQTLSGSLELREKFEELVSLYLEVISKKSLNPADNNRFLVISIDDLDMTKSGYEILEQIHRYFMVPDVLIYINRLSES